MKLLTIVFCSRYVAQPVNKSVGRRGQSVAYRQRDFARALAVRDDLVHRLHITRDLFGRGVVGRGTRETQLDRSCGIARLVLVPRKTYYGCSVKGVL